MGVVGVSGYVGSCAYAWDRVEIGVGGGGSGDRGVLGLSGSAVLRGGGSVGLGASAPGGMRSGKIPGFRVLAVGVALLLVLSLCLFDTL